MATKSEKTSQTDEKIDQVIDKIRQKHGEGSIMSFGQKPSTKIKTIRSGSISLDLAIGGGWPLGRIIEIYGPESSGKTTICLHAIAQAQKQGLTAAFIDAEHALDPVYGKKIGVDLDKLLLSQPDYGEQALEIAEDLIDSGAVNLVVIDSVAALTPKSEIDGTINDQQMGLQARMMSKALRRLTALVAKRSCSLVFTNQLRQKIGVIFGSPEVTTGGQALKFYASLRLDVRRIGAIKNSEEVLGNRVRVKVVKNKLAPPFRLAEFDIMYNEGISQVGDVLDLACEQGLVKKAGAWFSYQEEKVAQGRESAKDYLRANQNLLQKLDQELRQKIEGLEADEPGETSSKKVAAKVE